MCAIICMSPVFFSFLFLLTPQFLDIYAFVLISILLLFFSMPIFDGMSFEWKYISYDSISFQENPWFEPNQRVNMNTQRYQIGFRTNVMSSARIRFGKWVLVFIASKITVEQSKLKDYGFRLYCFSLSFFFFSFPFQQNQNRLNEWMFGIHFCVSHCFYFKLVMRKSCHDFGWNFNKLLLFEFENWKANKNLVTGRFAQNSVWKVTIYAILNDLISKIVLQFSIFNCTISTTQTPNEKRNKM